ncbi:MAG: hypothetical protein IT356_04330 [Gemmatimonadaceae bacterium]|nr:hypothetical protein [Gemmatimonadaceae bacterium]
MDRLLAGSLLAAMAGLAPVIAGAQVPSARAARAGIGAPFLAAATDPDAGSAKPSVEPARVFGEIFAGAYAGVAGYFVGTWVGSAIAEGLGTESPENRERIGYVVGILSATFATAGSVAAVGNIGDQTGSYPAALVGTAAGVAVGVLFDQMIYGHARLPSETGSSRMRWVSASIEALLPSFGATIAFNSTRRFK